MAEKCKYCDKRAYDDCLDCRTPACEMHGVLIGEQQDIICMPCKRQLLAQEDEKSVNPW